MTVGPACVRVLVRVCASLLICECSRYAHMPFVSNSMSFPACLRIMRASQLLMLMEKTMGHTAVDSIQYFMLDFMVFSISLLPLPPHTLSDSVSFSLSRAPFTRWNEISDRVKQKSHQEISSHLILMDAMKRWSPGQTKKIAWHFCVRSFCLLLAIFRFAHHITGNQFFRFGFRISVCECVRNVCKLSLVGNRFEQQPRPRFLTNAYWY